MLLLALTACEIKAEKPAGEAVANDTATPDTDTAPDDTACVPTPFYSDLDSDTFGDAANVVEACDAPAGYVANSDDCNDADVTISPTGTETCDEVDQDCDGSIDEEATDATVWYPDRDRDGLGADAEATTACEQPADYIAVGGDCDDYDRSTGAGTSWYADTDADGWGAAETVACTQPEGHIALSGDCDDTRADTHPEAAEVCDDLDQDCDGALDEDAIDVVSWYPDRDADGYGAGEATVACDAPADHADNADDCDDTSASINPGATETCSGLDEDCDTLIDADDPDMSGLATWYRDADGDDHGDPTVSQSSCTRPDGYALDPDDCDDADATVFPGADETCDATDEDCDGTPDDNAIDAATWYADGDGDGFGDVAELACDAPAGTVAIDGDCDDGDDTVHPDASEACDTIDNDCDGATDEGAWYADTDADTYGDPDALDTSCVAPSGFVADASDCDDTSAAISPAGTEHCDDVDEDCDGSVDDGAVDPSDWYADADGDTFGAGTAVAACDAPAGHVTDATDCDDTSASASPVADEHCDDVDEDCDGTVDDGAIDPTDWYADGDGDGYGSGTATSACDAPAGSVDNGDDCDDSSDAISPAAYETCSDGIDQDCDGADATVCDVDGDGYDVSTDCDDTDPEVNPGEKEVCDDADTDEDCDGVADDGDSSAMTVSKTRYYEDADGDGYGDPGGKLACEAPSGYVANDEDCDDTDSAISPDAQDVCSNLVDEDCSGEVDDCSRFGMDSAALTITGEAEDYFGKSAAGGDFDGDGDVEIVVAAPYGYPDESVFLFDSGLRGDATSSDAAVTLSGYGYCGYFTGYGGVFVGDTDADGLQDALFDCENNANLVYGGDLTAGGDLGTAVSARLWGGRNAFVDVDGDGLADPVGVGSEGSAYWVGVAFGPASGYYSFAALDCAVELLAAAAPNWSVTGVDLDGDGADSLAAVPMGGDNVFLWHDVCAASSSSDADVVIEKSTVSGQFWDGAAAADTDADGYEELIVASQSTPAFRLDSPVSGAVDLYAAAGLASAVSSGHYFSTIVAAELDGTPGDEVAFIEHSSYGQGPFYVIADWSTDVYIEDLVYPAYGATIEGDSTNILGDFISNAGDTDGDGTDDLLVTNYAGYGGTPGVWLFLGSDLFP